MTQSKLPIGAVEGKQVWVPGSLTWSVADIRAHADRLMCNGSWTEGKLLHTLLDQALKVGGIDTVAAELDEANEELRTAERDLRRAENAVEDARQLLDKVVAALTDDGKPVDRQAVLALVGEVDDVLADVV